MGKVIKVFSKSKEKERFSSKQFEVGLKKAIEYIAEDSNDIDEIYKYLEINGDFYDVAYTMIQYTIRDYRFKKMKKEDWFIGLEEKYKPQSEYYDYMYLIYSDGKIFSDGKVDQVEGKNPYEWTFTQLLEGKLSCINVFTDVTYEVSKTLDHFGVLNTFNNDGTIYFSSDSRKEAETIMKNMVWPYKISAYFGDTENIVYSEYDISRLNKMRKDMYGYLFEEFNRDMTWAEELYEKDVIRFIRVDINETANAVKILDCESVDSLPRDYDDEYQNIYVKDENFLRAIDILKNSDIECEIYTENNIFK